MEHCLEEFYKAKLDEDDCISRSASHPVDSRTDVLRRDPFELPRGVHPVFRSAKPKKLPKKTVTALSKRL
jgi:hypothetical protein